MDLKLYLSYLKETIENEFSITKGDLSKYKEFPQGQLEFGSEYDKTIVRVFNSFHYSEGIDHVEERFKERSSRGTIGALIGKNPYSWPDSYEEFIKKSIIKIYNYNQLENGAYNIVIRPLYLQLLSIVGEQPTRRDHKIKILLVNTVKPGDDDDNLEKKVKHRGRKIDANQLFVEEILKDLEIIIEKIR